MVYGKMEDHSTAGLLPLQHRQTDTKKMYVLKICCRVKHNRLRTYTDQNFAETKVALYHRKRSSMKVPWATSVSHIGPWWWRLRSLRNIGFVNHNDEASRLRRRRYINLPWQLRNLHKAKVKLSLCTTA